MDRVAVREEGKLVTHTANQQSSLTHTGEELTEGRHYWEVEIVKYYPFVGICRPDADPRTDHALAEATTAWLMNPGIGSLWGNGKENDDEAGGFNHGDRMGVLLDLDDGSLRFFRNGVEHGPGYPAGSVTGPVAMAAQMRSRRANTNGTPEGCWGLGQPNTSYRVCYHQPNCI